MKYLQELQNAIKFFLRETVQEETKTLGDVIYGLERNERYTKVKEYLNSLSESQSVQSDPKKTLIRNLFEARILKTTAELYRSGEQPKYIAKVIYHADSKVLFTWDKEFTRPENATTQLQAMLEDS